MGLIKQAILGPLALYGLLMAHVGVRMFFTEPTPIKVGEFSRDVSESDRAALVKARKVILRDVMEFLAGKPKKNFIEE